MSKKTQKITLAIIIIVIVSYLGIGLAMRNISPTWCNLSLGTYDIDTQPIILGELAGAMEMTNMPSSRTVYGCTGGIFGFLD